MGANDKFTAGVWCVAPSATTTTSSNATGVTSNNPVEQAAPKIGEGDAYAAPTENSSALSGRHLPTKPAVGGRTLFDVMLRRTAEVNEGKDHLFTSESVGPGHPDKVCDQVSDAVVDLFLSRDPNARVACNTVVKTGRVFLVGEIRSTAQVSKDEIEKLVRATIRRIGYEQEGFHWDRVKVEVHLHAQSADIAVGVDAGKDKAEGAGDQGMMVGYACRETPELMPASLQLSHKIMRLIAAARDDGRLTGIGPDGKCQVTLEYRDGKPVRAAKIVVSMQHHERYDQQDVRDLVRPFVLEAIPEGWMCDEDSFLVNPTGRFVIGGPEGDSGLTGRKIIVDTYGAAAPHGGGAFSGKDPSKVDRSAAYAARYLAKNVVAAGIADRCTIQIAYAIGVAEPMSVYVDTHGTGAISDKELSKILPKIMDLTPRGIRNHLSLDRPIYARTSVGGHFGREPERDGGFSWERTDLADKILSAAKTISSN